ncbi:hypothetical protein K491DRAFT_763865 [Lophiostoma macrostomum CBS 122681]|uniref:Uncharacterized protein n=1 Tax=Lophiostoma macrostomum CBS 122681 TaxID=1314788 RepID=A0A6A6SL19_9PLEO|nr:hypothetical protein K491DRAFT_763865 [Lophiostoma macrostomum CBS 122681]
MAPPPSGPACDSNSESACQDGYLTDATSTTSIPPEYYIEQWQNGDELEYLKQDYSPGTTVLLDRTEEQWHQFAKYIRQGPIKLYKGIRLNLLRAFFDWLLNQKTGRGGRRLRGTKYRSYLGTYWKLYRLVFDRATGDKINGQINRSMQKVLCKLATKHGLREFGREKPCIRPQALLELRYKHIDASIVRDKGGGPDRFLLEFGFEFTKNFLGAKDVYGYRARGFGLSAIKICD